MNDWGFLHNETKEGLAFPEKTRLIQSHLLLSEEENKVLHKMAEEMDMSTHGVLKQALRVLQMYRAGYLIQDQTASTLSKAPPGWTKDE